VFGTPPCLRSRRCQHPGSTFYHLRSVFLKRFFTSNLYSVGVANGIDSIFLVSFGSTRSFTCNPSGFLRRLHCCYHPLGADMSSYMSSHIYFATKLRNAGLLLRGPGIPILFGSPRILPNHLAPSHLNVSPLPPFCISPRSRPALLAPVALTGISCTRTALNHIKFG
jgi:hypothetical protein